jgi:DNA-binding transcriptional regulator YiaG
VRDQPVETSAEALLRARERANMTQDEAARLTHQSDGRVWRRWENGERRVNEAAAHLFAFLTDQRYPLADPG